MIKNLLLSAILFSTVSCAQKKSYFVSPDYSISENPKELSEFFYNYKLQTGKNFFDGKPNFATHYELKYINMGDKMIGKLIDSQNGATYNAPDIILKCVNDSIRTDLKFKLDKNYIQFLSCNLKEQKPFYYSYLWDEASKNFRLETMTTELPKEGNFVELNFNPDVDMDRTLALLDSTPNERAEEVKRFLTFSNYDNLDEDPRYASKLKKLWREMINEQYGEEEDALTEDQFDPRYKSVYDLDYLQWDHFGMNGNGGPSANKVYPYEYLGVLNGAYYFRMNFEPIPSYLTEYDEQGLKIYKVEHVDGRFLITGVFQEFIPSQYSNPNDQ